jgi:hypothetical protein
MTDRPEIKVGDWIYVGQTACVVAMVHQDSTICDCMVVSHPDKPTNSDVIWDGNQWSFAPGDFGGYAEHNPRLTEFVAKLKRGPHYKP